MNERYLDLTELSFVAGPLILPDDFSSVDLRDGEVYSPEAIAQAFLAVPGCRLRQAPDPSWQQWCARWESGQRYIEVDLMACPVDPQEAAGHAHLWGGSSLRTHCLLSDLLSFWKAVQRCCPAVWLHDTETRMWTPEAFAREAQAFQMRSSGQEWRPGWGKL